MALPDKLEQIGIVVGSIIMVSLPLTLIVTAISDISPPLWLFLLPYVVGFVVGVLVALDYLGIDYQTVWFVSLASVIIAAVGLSVLNISSTGNAVIVTAGVVISLIIAAILDVGRRRRTTWLQ